jgi:tetratricopeptide (TPR) repeat protein
MQPRLLLALGLAFTSILLASAQVSTSKSASPVQGDQFDRGLIALKENRFDAALEDLTNAERDHPNDARVRNFRGIALISLGRTEEAATEYQQAIRLNPTMEDAYRNLGFLQWTQHELAAAAKNLEHAVQLSPDDSFAHYYLGRVHLDGLRYREAFEEFDRSHVPWPEDPAFLLEAAIGYAALGRHKDARKTVEHVITMPLSDAQSVQAASLLSNLGEHDRAIALLEKLNLGNSRDRAWAQFDLALAQLIAGHYEQVAREAHAYAERMQPGKEAVDVSPAWSLIGIASAHLGEHEQAVEALYRVTKLSPSEEEGWLNLTRELMDLGRYGDAISAVHDALTSNPKSYALHLRLGAAYLAADRYREAEKAFRELIAAGDPLPTSYIGLVQVLLRTGRAEDAVSELAAAQQKLGATFLISYFRGLAFSRAGKSAEAVAAFKDAVQLNPNSAEAHLGLGKSELAQGRIPQATAELEETLRLDPANVQAQRLLSQAYRRAGDNKHAVEYAEASAKNSTSPAGDLVGDFFLPEWKMPSQSDHR